jgi:quinoprotein glucose dehydrogenase
MYLSWPFNHVAALVPETGAVLWEYVARSGFSGKLGSMRSLEYWPENKNFAPETIFATEEGELYALDAKTGKPVPGFGNEGVVSLKTPEVMNGFPNLHLGISSSPFIYKDLVITGSHIVDETGSKGPAGDVRAWDFRSGQLVWTFHSVPRPGEPGHESRQGDQWKGQSGVNVWTFSPPIRPRHSLHAVRFRQQQLLRCGPPDCWKMPSPIRTNRQSGRNSPCAWTRIKPD